MFEYAIGTDAGYIDVGFYVRERLLVVCHDKVATIVYNSAGTIGMTFAYGNNNVIIVIDV